MKKIIFIYLALVSFSSYSQTLELDKEVEIKIPSKYSYPNAEFLTIRDGNNKPIGNLIFLEETIKGKQWINFYRFDDNLEIQKFSIQVDGRYFSYTSDSKKIYLLLCDGEYSTTINCLSFDLETNEFSQTKTKLKFGEYYNELGQIEDNLFFICVSYMKPTVYYCNIKTGEVKKHEELSDKINLADFQSCFFEIYWDKEKSSASLLKIKSSKSRKLSNDWLIFEIDNKTLDIVKENKIKIQVSENTTITKIHTEEDGLLFIGYTKNHISLIKVDENGNGSEEIIEFEEIPEFKNNIGVNDSISGFDVICNFIDVKDNSYDFGLEIKCYVSKINKYGPYKTYYYNQTILLQTKTSGELIWGKSIGLNNENKYLEDFNSATMNINNEGKHHYSRVDWNNEFVNLCTLTDKDFIYYKSKSDGNETKQISVKLPAYSNPNYESKEFPISVSNTFMFSMNQVHVKDEYLFLIRKYSIK